MCDLYSTNIHNSNIMKIVLTGSIGNIGKPLTQALVQKGHAVTVISSKADRKAAIEALGATAEIGRMQDTAFLSRVFTGADIVYCMETNEPGAFFDKSLDIVALYNEIGHAYKQAIEQSGVKKVIHLSSIGAHTRTGNGILRFHYDVEHILQQLPADVSIKFMRPVGFYTNLLRAIPTIKSTGGFVSNYGGDQKEPWVSPLDIADTISEEIEQPFSGRTIRYIASEEISPNEIARVLGEAIGQPGLIWKVISNEELLRNWLAVGFNEQIAQGFIEMQASQGSGLLYEDYYRNRPVLGKTKFVDFAKDFAKVYQQ